MKNPQPQLSRSSLRASHSYAGPNPPEALKAGLASIVEQVRRAQQVFESGQDAATAAPSLVKW